MHVCCYRFQNMSVPGYMVVEHVYDNQFLKERVEAGWASSLHVFCANTNVSRISHLLHKCMTGHPFVYDLCFSSSDTKLLVTYARVRSNIPGERI